MRRSVFTLFLIAAGSMTALPAATSPAASVAEVDDLLRDAARVFARAVDTPAAAIPIAVLARASAIAVIPAAAVTAVGDRHNGTGVVSMRGGRPDDWTPPAVIAFEGSLPARLDTGAVDLILIAQTRVGAAYFVADGLAMPGRRIAAGALGHTARVHIDADIVGYMHFDRYFAGVTIENWVVKGMTEANAALYGRPYSTDDIVRGAGFFRLPSAARLWRDAIAGYFREMS